MTPWSLGLELLRSEPEKLLQYPMYVQKRDAKRKPKHAYTAPLSIRLIVVFRKLKVRGPISSAEVRTIFYDDLKWWSQEQTHRFMAKMSLGPNPFFIKTDNPFYAKGKNSRFLFERNPAYKWNEHTQKLVEKAES